MYLMPSYVRERAQVVQGQTILRPDMGWPTLGHMTTDEALDYFLEIRTADRRADLIAAGREAAKRRREGPTATRAVLAALHHEHNMSYREIETATSIPRVTAERLIAQGA